MGQIQNAFNAGVGSIIASKAMAEHLQNQAISAAESQYAEATKIGKDALELQNKSYENDMAKEAAENVIEESNRKLELKQPRDEKTGRFTKKAEYKRKLDMDIDEATKKLKELSKEQDSISAQKEAFKVRMDFYNNRHNILQNDIKHLPANKRPELPDLNKILSSQEWDATQYIKGQKKENK